MNKGELRTHFLALLNRSDCTDALADTFIDQAIGRIRRTLRIPSMERQQTYAVSSSGGLQSIVLPADLLETMDIYYDLVSDTDTNAFSEIASDGVIYTALGYASDYFLDERGPLFDGKASVFIAEIQDQADTAEQSGGTQVMRPTHTFSD